MSIKLWMWNKWVRIQAFVNKKFAAFAYQRALELHEAKQAEQVRLADEYLAWFRSRGSYVKPGTAGKEAQRKYCMHLKGGRIIKSVAYRDYCVAQHTFIDGRTKIWCLLNCGFVSWYGDKNWREAKMMMELSTNRSSSSEHFVQVRNVGA